MKPTLSILMPVYNGATFLSEQIISILNQEYADFELIILDDGSSDESVEICARFAQSDARVRVIEGKTNAGQKRRLIELITLSQGEFVAFSDQDDVWDRAKIHLLMNAIQNRSLAFGRSELTDGEGKPFGKTLLESIEVNAAPDERLGLLFNAQVSAHASVVRRSALSVASLHNVEPFDLLMGIEASFTDGLAYDDNAIVYHRMHANNQANRGLQNFRYVEPPLNFAVPRVLLKSGFADRVNFLRRIEYVACSSIVPMHTQKDFKRLFDACARSWFLRRDVLPKRDIRLRALLTDTLRPYAGSEEDWRFCHAQIETLTNDWRKRSRRWSVA